MALSFEDQVAALVAATTNQQGAVSVQQGILIAAIATFATTTARVNAMDKVQNTPDLEKVVSTATALVFATMQLKLVDTGASKNLAKINGQSLLGNVDLVVQRSPTSLNKLTYENRATIKTLPANADDSTLIEGLGLFMFRASVLEPEDDESCFNTNAGVLALDGVTPVVGQWLLEAVAFDLVFAMLAAQAAVLEDWMEDEPTRFATYFATTKTI